MVRLSLLPGVLALGFLFGPTVHAAPAHHAKAAASHKAAGVYVCKTCRCYYSPAQAKAMGYTEGGGPGAHHLIYASKPPAGYASGESMPVPHKG
ncbi:MAG: hypothetical protein M3Y13_13285 [Armatimonadota bacterium]|nr:hypothetical protein [Armatimonadota bacterium]